MWAGSGCWLTDVGGWVVDEGARDKPEKLAKAAGNYLFAVFSAQEARNKIA